MSPDGRLLATAGDGGILLIDAVTGELRRRLQGDADDGWFVNFSRDGSMVATVTFNQEAVIWDMATGDLRARLPLGEGGDVVDFAADGSTVYTAGSGSALRHWDLSGDRRFIAQVASAPPELGDESFVQPAPGGDLIAFPNGSGRPRAVDPSESHVSFLDVEAGTVGEPLNRGKGYRPLHAGGSWHPDGVHFTLATGGEIRIWNARRNQVVAKGRPSGPFVTAVDYSTDGSRLAIGELSGRLTMLDPATLTSVGSPVKLEEPVVWVSAAPDNRTVIALTGVLDAAGFWVGSSTGWSIVDLESGLVLDQGSVGINASHVAFSPDGMHAALSGKDGEVLVLDTETGEQVRPPVVGHGDNVSSLVYSPDGERILTSAMDSTIGLWDAKSGLLLARVVTPQFPVAAEFREDPNSVLIAPLWDGPVYEWDTRIDHAVAFACRVAGRDFTEVEWAEQFGERPYQRVCSP
jgi:WD40 repeat protein